MAEDERIQEESRIRSAEEESRRRQAEERRDRAKNALVLKALSEFSDLEALREEKRAIMEEEQRLKALLSLEKVKTHGKTDRWEQGAGSSQCAVCCGLFEVFLRHTFSRSVRTFMVCTREREGGREDRRGGRSRGQERVAQR